MTEREKEILDLIRIDPFIAQQEIADRLGISRSAVAGHIMNLTNKGVIQGKGYVLAPEHYAVVLGGANIDLTGRAAAKLVVGDSNPGVLSSSAGGVGRNIADNLSRLGSRCQFVGVLGDDHWAEMLLEACRQAGVETGHCLIETGESSSCYLSIHDTGGEMQLALNDMELIERLTPEQLAKRDALLSRATVIAVDANLSEAALAYLFDHYGDKQIFVDPVSSVKAPKLSGYLNRIDTLKPNCIEAGLLSGIEIEGTDDVVKAADKLHQLGVRRVLISLGAEGCYASDRDHGAHWLNPHNGAVSNVTGGGDALMAGLIHGELNQWAWQDSTQFSFAAAALAVAADSTINPEMSEAAVLRLLGDK